MGLLFIAVAIVFILTRINTLPAKSPMGDPGARVFPIAVSIGIIAMAIVIIIQSLRNPIDGFKGLKDPEGKQSATRALLVFCDLCVFLVLWRFIPFVIAGFIFLFVQCMIFREKLIFSIIYSGAIAGVLYAMSTFGLQVNLNLCFGAY